jgi:hypothetical protein
VPLAVGADGTASLRVVSSNLITTANLEVKADSDGGGILGTLPCTFGQSYGFRYKGLIGTNPQGFDLVPLPESPITLPPWSVGIPALPVWQPGDDVVVYNSGYDTDLGWEYSPLVLSATGQVMTATLHLTFQRDDTLAPSPNYFLHNHVPVPKIISNDDTVNLLLPNASNFAPVQGHKLRVTFTPYREWLVQSVEIQLVPSDEAQYYVYVSPKAVSMGPKVRLGTAEVTTDAQGLAVVSLTAGERINTCRYFELQVTDLTQLEQ